MNRASRRASVKRVKKLCGQMGHKPAADSPLCVCKIWEREQNGNQGAEPRASGSNDDRAGS